MPNIKSAKKRVKVIQTKTLRNQMIKSAVKTYIKKFEAAAAAGDRAVAEPAFNLAVKKIDQAVSKGIMKKYISCAQPRQRVRAGSWLWKNTKKKEPESKTFAFDIIVSSDIIWR